MSVCTSAQEELWGFYRIDSELVLNGVDVDEFKPGENTTGIVEVAGNDVGKGADIIRDLRDKGARAIQRLGFEGRKSDRWRQYSTAVLPSRHEAGSYAQLEAMATGLKIVSSYTGFFKSDVRKELFSGTDDFYWGTFDYMLDEVESTEVRQWVIDNATLYHFKKGWEGIIGPDQYQA